MDSNGELYIKPDAHRSHHFISKSTTNKTTMFALKQVSLMALVIASAYAAPQLDLAENAKNINTGDYINVRKHQSSQLKSNLA